MESAWSLDFCLACDKQTSEGGAYCSQACRAADLHHAESRQYTPSSAPSSPPTTFSSWTFPQASTTSHSHSHSHYNHDAFEEASTLNSKRNSIFSLDGLLSEATATVLRSSTASSDASTASSPTSERQHFLADHVRKALQCYESMFDQNRHRKHSTAS